MHFLVFLDSKDICICLVGQIDFKVSETCLRVANSRGVIAIGGQVDAKR